MFPFAHGKVRRNVGFLITGLCHSVYKNIDVALGNLRDELNHFGGILKFSIFKE